MNDIRNILEGPTGCYVVDETGLTKRYDFELRWTLDDTPVDSPLPGGPSWSSRDLTAVHAVKLTKKFP